MATGDRLVTTREPKDIQDRLELGHQGPATQDDEFARIHPHNSYKYHKRRIPPGSSEMGAEERSTRTDNLVTTRLLQWTFDRRGLTRDSSVCLRKDVQEC